MLQKRKRNKTNTEQIDKGKNPLLLSSYSLAFKQINQEEEI